MVPATITLTSAKTSGLGTATSTPTVHNDPRKSSQVHREENALLDAIYLGLGVFGSEALCTNCRATSGQQVNIVKPPIQRPRGGRNSQGPRVGRTPKPSRRTLPR